MDIVEISKINIKNRERIEEIVDHATLHFSTMYILVSILIISGAAWLIGHFRKRTPIIHEATINLPTMEELMVTPHLRFNKGGVTC